MLGAITGSAAGDNTIVLNASGIALVQGWVDGTAAQRPRLTVTYQ